MNKFIKLCKLPLLVVSAALFLAFTVCLIVVSTMPHGKTYTNCYKMDLTEFADEMGLGEDVKGSVTAKQRIVIEDDKKVVVYATYTLDGVDETVKTTLETLWKYAFGEEFKLGEEFKMEEEAYVLEDGKVWTKYVGEGKKVEDVVKEINTKEDEPAYKINAFKLVDTDIEAKEKELNEFPDKNSDDYKLVKKAYDELVEQETYTCTTNVALRVVSIVLMVVGALCTAGCAAVIVLDKNGKLGKKETTEAAA